MPIQVYRCPEHGEFEVKLSFKDKIPDVFFCEAVICFDYDCDCGLPSEHVLKPPAAIIVEGGTGAGSGRR